jgi:membrane protein DedA with SNARE-associated domain
LRPEGFFVPWTDGLTEIAAEKPIAHGRAQFPWRRFARFDAIAALIWALYASLLGFFGGRAFEGSAWKGLVVAFAIALAVTGGIELTRWIMRRRRPAG